MTERFKPGCSEDDVSFHTITSSDGYRVRDGRGSTAPIQDQPHENNGFFRSATKRTLSFITGIESRIIGATPDQRKRLKRNIILDMPASDVYLPTRAEELVVRTLSRRRFGVRAAAVAVMLAAGVFGFDRMNSTNDESRSNTDEDDVPALWSGLSDGDFDENDVESDDGVDTLPLEPSTRDNDDWGRDSYRKLFMKPLRECEKVRAFAVAKDVDGDGIRDNLDPKDVFCVNNAVNKNPGVAILTAKFHKRFQDRIGNREAFNYPKTKLTNRDPHNLAQILVARGIIKDKGAAELAAMYMDEKVVGKDGNRHDGVISRVNNPKAWGGKVPEYSLEVVDGVLYVYEDENSTEPNPNNLPRVFFADLFPWDEPQLNAVYSSDVSNHPTLDQLTPITPPKCPKTTNWEWKRPDDDQFDPDRDLNFVYQNGQKAHHKYLAGLARILPSNWNIAAMPTSESGIAIEMMFDGCCDFSPKDWFKDNQRYMGTGPKDIIVEGTRGGFAVAHPSGVYAFEPGKRGHLRWNAKSATVRSGDEAVGAELSHYDENPSNDINPRLAKTYGTLVRRGNPEGSERYWNKDDGWDRVLEDNWERNTAPAGLAAIKYLVGNAPFWLSDYYWGGFQTFEGSGQLKLLEAKKDPNGDHLHYKVQFIEGVEKK